MRVEESAEFGTRFEIGKDKCANGAMKHLLHTKEYYKRTKSRHAQHSVPQC